MPLNAERKLLAGAVAAVMLLAGSIGLPGNAHAAPQLQAAPDDSMPPPPAPARYDAVGYAAVVSALPGAPAISATHAGLPAGSFVELTALDNGKTIIVIIADGVRPRDGWLLNLSTGAAALLGGGSGKALQVRVRQLDPPGIDQASLRNGRPATERIDAPPVLLRGLRKRLPPQPTAVAIDEPRVRPPRTLPGAPYLPPARSAAAIVASPARAGLYVQIAALSSSERATALAQSTGGGVFAGGGIYRVRLGPYADPASAERVRNSMAQSGYGDARIVRE